MPNDTVTLALHGEVSLSTFAEAVSRFDALVQALAWETDATQLKWVISNLEVSSAVATARGVSTDGDVEHEEAERVVRGFLEVGRALARGVDVPFSEAVEKPARALTEVLNGDVSLLRFETAEDDAAIRSPVRLMMEEEALPPIAPPTYGAVEGRVQTLSSRSGLRFTVYDTHYDRAVSCYLADGYEEIMRNAWGHLAVVEGRVTRDPESGRPLAVRQVRHVEVLPEVESVAYRRLRGIGARGDLSAEDAIRRLRDAG